LLKISSLRIVFAPERKAQQHSRHPYLNERLNYRGFTAQVKKKLKKKRPELRGAFWVL